MKMNASAGVRWPRGAFAAVMFVVTGVFAGCGGGGATGGGSSADVSGPDDDGGAVAGDDTAGIAGDAAAGDDARTQDDGAVDDDSTAPDDASGDDDAGGAGDDDDDAAGDDGSDGDDAGDDAVSDDDLADDDTPDDDASAGDDEAADDDTADDDTADDDAADDDTTDDDTADDDAADDDTAGDDTMVDDDAAGDDDITDSGKLWDLDMIRDPATAHCTFTNQRSTLKDGVTVDVWDVSYVSWEVNDGVLTPIVIHAFASKPAGRGANIPGVVQAHGLGGFAEESHATGPAALLDAFVIAYTGPGGGDPADPRTQSEGQPSGAAGGPNNLPGYRMFDTLADTRGTWFWGHAVAAMRGLTCLETRPEVDRTRLGMTGFSAGAVATLIAAGVDDRIKAAVPLSGTHAWNIAIAAANAWQHTLLSEAGLDTSSPEWTTLIDEIISPAATIAHTQSKVLMVNGSTDEFFPLTAHVATYDAISGADKRTALAANFDHGCYSLSGVEPASDIEERADIHGKGGQRAWFKHWFGTDAHYAYMPLAPAMTVQPAGGVTVITAVVDPGGPDLDVESVTAFGSSDDCVVFGGVELKSQGNGVYGDITLFPIEANTVTYVDVQYKVKGSIGLPIPGFEVERFALSSRPEIPAGFVPRIRGITSCTP